MKELVKISGPEIVEAQPVHSNLFGLSDPTAIIKKAAEHADALAKIIKKKHLYKTIGSKDHVFVEGWTLLGSMLGVFPVCTWTKPIEGGWEARVEARTLSGSLVGAAEASCLRAEANWKNRDDYALRSMAQTRATSKALRLPLGFIVVLAGYSGTPAEEMPSERPAEAVEQNLEPVLEDSLAYVKDKGTVFGKEQAEETDERCPECDGAVKRYTRRGKPDIMACAFGRSMWLENFEKTKNKESANRAAAGHFYEQCP